MTAVTSPNSPAAKEAAQKLAQRLHDWMRTLKVQSGEFMPPDVVCDYAGMRNFINAMAKVIGEDPLLTRVSELEAGLKKCVAQFEDMDEAMPYVDAGCIQCTAGTVPNHRNTGLCGYHAAKGLLEPRT